MNLIQQLVVLIEENLNSPLSAKRIAERSGYSVRWLYNLFQEKTGISVAQYIRRRKLTLGAVMMRHTSRQVTDISLMYNFSSPQAFSRSFRQQFKMSPVQYRNSDTWDMQYAQPVLYSTTRCTEFRLFGIAAGNSSPVPRHKKFVQLGMDYIHTRYKGRFIYNQKLFQSVKSIFESVDGMSDFMISGEMVPSEFYDSELIYTFEKTDKYSRPEMFLPDGFYASQKFRGTYKEIFEFQIYDAMNALYNNKCILKRGPRFTFFHKTDNKDIMNVQYLIPCVKP
ncbi:AraC family transcriptional regulator [Escherichia coli]|uniref:helix-turn-helix domain-containing protein n=1 Tax=Escherichia coli TaxID=562 RepID=UPI00191B8370|nr:helix-turn-helix domain-containing protein [Escherichia coli]CAD6177004.1 AraC family transcriptional regulator [Escherichia coli]